MMPNFKAGTKENVLKSVASEQVSMKQVFRTVRLQPGRIAKLLLGMVFTLLVAHLVSLYFLLYVPSQPRLSGLINKFFNFTNEANFPTIFSSFLLLFVGALCFTIYLLTPTSKKAKRPWLVLSFVFVFLFADELAQIHDELVLTIRNRLPSDASSYLHNGWIIPYSLLVLAGGAYFLRFVLRLPGRTRNLFFLAGAMYVFAALGMEFIESHEEKLNGYSTLLYIYITLEEVLEMCGIILFVYALLDYMKPLNLRFISGSKAI